MTTRRLERILRDRGVEISGSLGAGDAACPESEILREFLEGRLASDNAQQIAWHLLACRECAETVLAWDAIEQEEAPITQRPMSARRLWLRFAAPVAAAAAAIIASVVVWWAFQRPPFTAELIDSVGAVRSAVVRRDAALQLKVSLPRASHVYVVALDRDGGETLFPEAEDAELPAGVVLLPRSGRAWKFEDVSAGKCALLVGLRSTPLPPADAERLRAALEDVRTELDVPRLREAARRYFDDVAIVPFTVMP